MLCAALITCAGRGRLDFPVTALFRLRRRRCECGRTQLPEEKEVLSLAYPGPEPGLSLENPGPGTGLPLENPGPGLSLAYPGLTLAYPGLSLADPGLSLGDPCLGLCCLLW